MAFLPASRGRPAFACASMTFITTHQCDYEDDQVEVMWKKLVNKEKNEKKKKIHEKNNKLVEATFFE